MSTEQKIYVVSRVDGFIVCAFRYYDDAKFWCDTNEGQFTIESVELR